MPPGNFGQPGRAHPQDPTPPGPGGGDRQEPPTPPPQSPGVTFYEFNNCTGRGVFLLPGRYPDTLRTHFTNGWIPQSMDIPDGLTATTRGGTNTFKGVGPAELALAFPPTEVNITTTPPPMTQPNTPAPTYVPTQVPKPPSPRSRNDVLPSKCQLLPRPPTQ